MNNPDAADTEDVPTPEQAQQPEAAPDALAVAKKEAADNLDRYMRAVADLENFRRRTVRDKEELSDLPFPMLADVKRELTTALGILDAEAGVAQRATYIVDPEGIIRFVSVNDLSVGRNPQEVLRVLDALQTDELCPCNWQKGEEVIKTAA